MKSTGNPLFSLINALMARCASLDKLVSSAQTGGSANASSAKPVSIAGMELWNSVRLQPELSYSGAFFGLGSADASNLGVK